MADREYTFPEEVKLISVTETTSGTGDTVQTEQYSMSYAEIVSPYMRETYEAMAQGLKPEFVAVLPSCYDDYHGERQLEYQGCRYNIIRVYRANDGTCELTVSRTKANVSNAGTLASGLSGGA